MKNAIKQKYLKSFDGTKIGYQVLGTGKKWFVLANGLGGRVVAWEPIYKNLLKEYKFLCWDYRGLYTSEIPENEKTLRIPYHARDLVEILKKEKVRKAIFTGWSMGTQVCLEAYKTIPDKFKALFLINGTYGYPFKTAFNSPISRYIVPIVAEFVKRTMPNVQGKLAPVAKKVINRDEFLNLIIKLGLVQKTVNRKIFKQIADDIIHTDLGVYHDILLKLGQHDASDVLSEIQVPTLIMTGTKDMMTPTKVGEYMAKKIPHAELMVINHSSHYALMESPDQVMGRLNQFLKEYKL